MSLFKEPRRLTVAEQITLIGQSAYDVFVKESDGCTAAPDLTFRECCVEHDVAYRSGKIKRSEADARLRECMRAHGYVVLPWVYWAAVRIFGRGFYYGAKPAIVERKDVSDV